MTDEMGAVASAAEPGKANSCQYVNDNKPKGIKKKPYRGLTLCFSADVNDFKEQLH